MKNRFLLATAVLIPVVVFIVLRAGPSEKTLESRTYFLMDTEVTVSLPPGHQDDGAAAVERMRGIADKAGYEPGLSEIAHLNSGSGQVRLSKETADILRKALYYSDLSEGAFDITTGALTRAWGFRNGTGNMPAADVIAAARRTIGRDKITLDGRGVARRLHKGTEVDLGGIAKGYAVDRAVELLQERGVPYGVIEAGGDLRTWGTKPDRGPWRIGVRHPRSETEMLATITSDEALAVATSGDYQRCFFHNGKRYCHVMDPATGYPAAGVISATVMATTAAAADAVATSVMVMGLTRGTLLLEQMGLDGLIVTADGKVHRVFTMDRDPFESEVGDAVKP